MDRLSALLPKVLHKRGIKHEADASLVVYHAQKWLKEHDAQEGTNVTKLQYGTLFIETLSSVAAQECHGMTNDLLEELQATFPNVTLDTIRILRSSQSGVE
jgi:hypothetical protein